jgi:hypothetical protein
MDVDNNVILTRETDAETRSMYGEKISVDNTYPTDRCVKTPQGTLVPVATEYGGIRDGAHKFEKIQVLKIECDPDFGEHIIGKELFLNREKSAVNFNDNVVINKTAVSGDGKTAEFAKQLDALMEMPIQQEAPAGSGNPSTGPAAASYIPTPVSRPAIKVVLRGSFGEVVLPALEVLDGDKCVVVITDPEGFSYKPPISREPFELIKPDKTKYSVFHAGLFFSRDEVENYTVFIKEDAD